MPYIRPSFFRFSLVKCSNWFMTPIAYYMHLFVRTHNQQYVRIRMMYQKHELCVSNGCNEWVGCVMYQAVEVGSAPSSSLSVQQRERALDSTDVPYLITHSFPYYSNTTGLFIDLFHSCLFLLSWHCSWFYNTNLSRQLYQLQTSCVFIIIYHMFSIKRWKEQ